MRRLSIVWWSKWIRIENAISMDTITSFSVSILVEQKIIVKLKQMDGDNKRQTNTDDTWVDGCCCGCFCGVN